MLDTLTSPIALPAWLFWIIVAFATLTLLDRLLLPWMRWYIRNRVRAVLNELDERLPLKLDSFRLTRRQVIINRLLSDPAIQAIAENHMRESLQSRDRVMAEIESYIAEIVPAFNPWIYFNIMARVVRWLVERLYILRIDHEGGSPIENIPAGSTIVYVMNHRSNLDYLMVGHLSANHTALSYAVGEWARFWPLEPVIRSLGAYFVRRNSQNPLYRKVLERYVAMTAREGVTQAMFPEGGLSRDGAMRDWKFGLFGYMLRDFDPGKDRDIVFIPVAINYDRVLEDRTLLNSLDPDRQAPGLWGMVSTVIRYLWLNARLLLTRQWRRYGMACARFGKPVSARNYLTNPVNFPKDSNREEQIEHLASHVNRMIQSIMPNLTIPLLCQKLLDEPDKNWSEQDLLAWLSTLPYLKDLPKEASKAGFALAARRHLLKANNGHWIMNAQEEALIRYYANSIASDKA